LREIATERAVIALGISSVSFRWYGMSRLLSRASAVVFERYRLVICRLLTGVFAVRSKVGLIVGFPCSIPGLSVYAGGRATMQYLALILCV
jgi:hypothetical protein